MSEFGQGLIVDPAWVTTRPMSEATAELALAAAAAADGEMQSSSPASSAALDAIYAGGDFTVLFSGDDEGFWKPRRRRIY